MERQTQVKKFTCFPAGTKFKYPYFTNHHPATLEEISSLKRKRITNILLMGRS